LHEPTGTASGPIAEVAVDEFIVDLDAGTDSAGLPGTSRPLIASAAC
jgi:hypothetical protein